MWDSGASDSNRRATRHQWLRASRRTSCLRRHHRSQGLQAPPKIVRREREIAQELRVGPVGAVRGPPGRFPEVCRGEAGIEIVQQRSVVDKGFLTAPLGIARDFSALEHEIRAPVDGQIGGADCLDDAFENEPVAGGHVPQDRMRHEREDECEIEAARAQHHGPATRSTAQNRDPVDRAGCFEHLHQRACMSENDNRPSGFPEEQRRALAASLGALE